MADPTLLEELERRLRADPSSVAFANLAEQYRRAGRFDDTVIACRSGLTHHPGYVSARVTLGRALVALGDLSSAADELRAVLADAPDNLAAREGLAELAAAQAAGSVEEPSEPGRAERHTPESRRSNASASIAPLERFVAAARRRRRSRRGGGT